MAEKKLANLRPALYSFRLADIQAVGDLCGYTIALHGSMQRDIDIVAIPWVEGAFSAEALVACFCESLPVGRTDGDPKHGPHGRLSYTLLMGGSLFMDLSVMPRQTEPSDDREAAIRDADELFVPIQKGPEGNG